jgi:sulfatase maturation enzyme AslB (radical SAM superfamily)
MGAEMSMEQGARNTDQGATDKLSLSVPLPCRKAGIEITWRCNQRCIHCYYRRNHRLGRANDKPLEEAIAQVDAAKARGCNHIYLVGWGEPALYPRVNELLEYCNSQNLPMSMITNGSVPLRIYEKLFAKGLDHIHISMHAIGPVHSKIAGLPGAYGHQRELREWLRLNGLAWRSNTTLMQANYRMLNDIVEEALEFGDWHFVMLTFLPHYEWKRHVLDMAVPVDLLAPTIEAAADLLLAAGRLFTIRYFPFCHLQPKYWRYVVNAYYVQFDPWEWEYGQYNKDDIRSTLRGARALRKNVRIESCEARCLAWRHCGGWNRNYANAFGGDSILRPITEVPDVYRDCWDVDGGLHVLNPANLHSGTIRTSCADVGAATAPPAPIRSGNPVGAGSCPRSAEASCA